MSHTIFGNLNMGIIVTFHLSGPQARKKVIPFNFAKSTGSV